MKRTTRSTSEKQIEPKSHDKENEIQRRMFLINNTLVEKSNIKFFTLRHPGTERKAFFHHCLESKRLFQLLQFKEPNRCFFIGENVSSNGSFYITIPFDFTFLFLYYIRKNCKTKAMSIDQLEDPDYPELSNLLSEFFNEDLLVNISDIKEAGESKYFKYNENKSLTWLTIKTERLSEHLLNNTDVLPENSGSISANYTKSETLKQFSKSDYLLQACDIVGSFITKDLKDLLMKHLSISDSRNTKRKSTKLEDKNNKKFKNENGNIKENLIKSPQSEQFLKKEKGPTTKELKFAKAASGTKSISSFFSKK